MDHQSLISNWIRDLQTHLPSIALDHPNYYASQPSQLITTSVPQAFTIGSGNQILNSMLPTCLNATSELLIVTCFIATSPSLDTLRDLLIQLSEKASSRNHRIRVRICFSSVSLWQKLSQTASLDGKIWLPSEWTSLGLPSEEQLRGLELEVKSIFVRPFSVMHPKFIVVDRKTAVVLSANVSWEEWFEGAIVLKGEVCNGLLRFWEEVWGSGGGKLTPLSDPTDPEIQPEPQNGYSVGVDEEPIFINHTTFLSVTSPPRPPTPIQTIILPSPHHTNPSFHPFSLSPTPPPPTPLNLFLLHVLATATRNIKIITPNLTSPPVTSALLAALSRGVNIHLITSRKLMLLEQLLTACTITELEVWKLRRRYRHLLGSWERIKQHNHDIEANAPRPGRLTIGYFKEGTGASERDGDGADGEHVARSREGTYLVKTHLKLMVADEEVTVLGSGNMDRASWWTSQELGVAFFGREVAGRVWRCVEEGMAGRVEFVC